MAASFGLYPKGVTLTWDFALFSIFPVSVCPYIQKTLQDTPVRMHQPLCALAHVFIIRNILHLSVHHN